MRPQPRRRTLLLLVTLWLGACTTVREVQRGPALERHERWVLLPLRNQTETPQAGEKAEAIMATLLRARGLDNLGSYRPPSEVSGELPDLDDRRRHQRALDWAKTQGYRYAVTGSVEELRYRNGLDGEPAVGLTVQVVELTKGHVVWSASGAKAGWGRDTLAGTTQELLRALLGELDLR